MAGRIAGSVAGLLDHPALAGTSVPAARLVMLAGRHDRDRVASKVQNNFSQTASLGVSRRRIVRS